MTHFLRFPHCFGPILVAALALAACGDSGGGTGQVATVSGDAIPFNGGDRRVEGAEVWILE